ncbi:hypothetical protein ACFE04_010120 [Oxalis oulophora]
METTELYENPRKKRPYYSLIRSYDLSTETYDAPYERANRLTDWHWNDSHFPKQFSPDSFSLTRVIQINRWIVGRVKVNSDGCAKANPESEGSDSRSSGVKSLSVNKLSSGVSGSLLTVVTEGRVVDGWARPTLIIERDMFIAASHLVDNKEKGLLLQLGEAGFKGRAKLGLSMLKSPALTFLNPFLKTRSGIDPFSSCSSLLSNLASRFPLGLKQFHCLLRFRTPTPLLLTYSTLSSLQFLSKVTKPHLCHSLKTKQISFV